MKVVGWIATVLGAGVVAVVLILTASSVPDIKRYLEMRRM